VGRRIAQATTIGDPSNRSFYPPSGVIRISTGKVNGSVFYAKDRLIVTNAHVVGDITNIAISFSGQTPFLGQVVFRDDELDFAIIETTTPGTPLPIRRGPVTLGEHIIAMGFPQGRQVMASSTGTVMDVVDCCIAHDALVAGGSSGGPLLDARYEVLGLNTLLSKKPGDKANETDRAITVRMDFIMDILRSEQA
jgi:S1-C subfamily serine protease